MTFGSGMIVFSDIYQLYDIIKQGGIMMGRNLLIDTLREAYSADREFHYVSDKFGYPKTPSQLGLDPDAGTTDDLTTRIFIGSTHRDDISFYPALTVRPTNISYFPISFNRNRGTIRYGFQKLTDGYGNSEIIQVPVATIFTGAWDQSFEIKVSSRSLEDVTSLADGVMVILQEVYNDDLLRNGLFIKKVSAGGQSEENRGEADPVYHIAISVETYSEWRREIPISNLIERIQLCFSFDISPLDVPAIGLDGKFTIT